MLGDFKTDDLAIFNDRRRFRQRLVLALEFTLQLLDPLLVGFGLLTLLALQALACSRSWRCRLWADCWPCRHAWRQALTCWGYSPLLRQYSLSSISDNTAVSITTASLASADQSSVRF